MPLRRSTAAGSGGVQRLHSGQRHRLLRI